MMAARQIGTSTLKTLRGMIIDRDVAWRADAEMAPVIDGAIRNGLNRIDQENCGRIYTFLRYGPMGADGQRQPLEGNYKTCGLDEEGMRKAWRRYYKKHYPKPVDAVTQAAT